MVTYSITKDTSQTVIPALPRSPGVYCYTDGNGRALYVGKAKNLQSRIRQYFTRDDAIGEKTRVLVNQIQSVAIWQTASEFDALLLEANRIRAFQPKYNVIARDDKSPLYVCLTLGEALPRVIFVRKPKDTSAQKRRAYFGPFQSARVARKILRQIRRAIPYCTAKRRDGRPCFYTQVGLCDPCPSFISKLQDIAEKRRLTALYKRNITRLKDMLSGNTSGIITDLEHTMKRYANKRMFEQAQRVYRHILALRHIQSHSYDPSLYVSNASFLDTVHHKEESSLCAVLRPFYPQLTQIRRIECIDISSTGGAHATGSLVVFTDGMPNPPLYRRFRIRSGGTPHDVDMIREVLARRLAHTEWPMPDVLIVDGGKPQAAAAKKTLDEAHSGIPLIALAKRREDIVIPVNDSFRVVQLEYNNPALHLVARVRDEAHRFAISYHRLLRTRAFSDTIAKHEASDSRVSV